MSCCALGSEPRPGDRCALIQIAAGRLDVAMYGIVVEALHDAGAWL